MGGASPAEPGAVVVFGETRGGSALPLRDLGRSIISAATVAEAVCAAAAGPDLVVIGEGVDTAEALASLEEIHGVAPGIPVVVLSGKQDARAESLLLRKGACACLPVPLAEAGLARIRAIVAAASGNAARRRDRFFAAGCPATVPMVGQSEEMRRTLETVRLVADSPCNPVLIVGETGTGKELVARAIHTLRHGAPDPFVAVNCAGLTANLLESELFGHVKGAFTGADSEKMGLFEVAGWGTLFLDEISEMPQDLQAKLLRVLQEKRFRKIGGTQSIPCHATIIASSNRNLAAAARENRFRRDLYYRLAVFPISLSPLRAPERREDIPLLADYFVEVAAPTCRGPARRLSESAREHLKRHAWPGNVRELHNVIERAMILARAEQIGPEDLVIEDPSLPPTGGTGLGVPNDDFSLETAERLFITRALQETGWQRTRAAALLGITRATLHAKLKRYKITIPDGTAAADVAPGGGDRASRLQEVLP